MAEPDPITTLLALMRDIADGKVTDDPIKVAVWLRLDDGERADVSRAVATLERTGWAWLPPDSPVYRLTDDGRDELKRGAP